VISQQAGLQKGAKPFSDADFFVLPLLRVSLAMREKLLYAFCLRRGAGAPDV
jgi:hypothetical protein